MPASCWRLALSTNNTTTNQRRRPPRAGKTTRDHRRSLGLTLVEAATGRYPYDAGGGPVALMVQVLHDAPPLPPPGGASEELRDFARRCLALDPRQRPSAVQLLGHPWIARAAAGGDPHGGAPLPPLAPDFPQPAAPLDGPGTAAKAFVAAAMLDPLEK